MNKILMNERFTKEIKIIRNMAHNEMTCRMVMPLGEGYMDIATINKLLDEINEDRSVPKNIRNSIMGARQHLNSDADVAIRINGAVSILDEISNDPNIPIYTRTQIWNIVSMLEILDKR